MKINYNSVEQILFMNVDWREFNSVREMITETKQYLPPVDVIAGTDLKIKGKFPYQLGMWLIKRYERVCNSISVYDPQLNEFYKYP